MAYNPKHKISLHKSIVVEIDDWITKGGRGGKLGIFFTEEFYK